jgi:hypothetical protein
MSLKNLVDTLSKKLVVGAIAVATVSGTYLGNDGGFTPFYNRKIGASYGINIGVVTDFLPGSKFYGIDISAFSDHDSSEFNGIDLSGFNITERASTMNGLQAGILNIPLNKIVLDLNGAQIGACGYSSSYVNGVQLGLYNDAERVSLGQIGVYNSVGHDSTLKQSLLLNIGKGESR